MPLPPRRPDPEPLRTNDVLVILVGTAAWAVAGLVLLLGFHGTLRAHHTSWWLWSCLAGVLMGGYGLWYVHRRDGRRPRG